MEYVEFLPGALAAGWMLVRIAILVRNGNPPQTDENQV
jgi:hypothetical protein